MKTIASIDAIESINDILRSRGGLSDRFYSWSAEKDGDFINEPDRAARCYDAASEGVDGKLNCEAIDDFREFGAELLDEAETSIENSMIGDCELAEDEFTTRLEAAMLLIDECRAAFHDDCDNLEKWHIENGTYSEMVG